MTAEVATTSVARAHIPLASFQKLRPALQRRAVFFLQDFSPFGRIGRLLRAC
jgi:hypothetical protein